MKTPAKLESARQKRNRRRARREAREIRRAMRMIEQGVGAQADSDDEEDRDYIAYMHPDIQEDLREAMAQGEIGTVGGFRLVRVPK